MIRICTAYLNYRDSNSALLFFSDILIRFGEYVNSPSFSRSLHPCLCQISLFCIPLPRSFLQHPFKISLPSLLVFFLFPVLLTILLFLSLSLSCFLSLSFSAEAKPHPSVKRAKCWRHTKTTYPAAVKSYFNLNIHSMEREEKVD